MTGSSALSPAEVQAAEARLSAGWGERAGVLAAEAIQGRTDVFRLRLAGGRSAVLKRRGEGREEGRHGGEAAGFGIELATLEYLNAMPVAVAPRLLGADTEAGIVLMEDLGPGPSLADSLLTGQPGQAKADLIAYARALGRLHAWSRSRPGWGPSSGAAGPSSAWPPSSACRRTAWMTRYPGSAPS